MTGSHPLQNSRDYLCSNWSVQELRPVLIPDVLFNTCDFDIDTELKFVNDIQRAPRNNLRLLQRLPRNRP
jgi:hypothetical protein